MQLSLLVTFVLAVHPGAYGLAIVRPTKGKEFSLSQFNATTGKLARVGSEIHNLPSSILVRPHAAKGVPDEVKFAMRAMNFYGADLKHHTFSIDVVMSLWWNDPRVASLIPDGLDKLSMSKEQAEKVMWMPGIIVSNRDIEKYEIISASVTIHKSGDISRVERANARVMKKFALAGYPFDSQDLTVNIASSKYMLDEVVLVPDKSDSGVYEDIWGLYFLEDWHTEAYQAMDGELKKSRGSLVMKVKRSLEKYSQDHLLPASIVLMISWAVFYFPFANPFITARLALSILALLSFTNLIVKSSKELPGAAPFNWNDLFNQQIQTLMFVTIVLNVCSEIAFHTFQYETLARGLNHEAKLLMPFMSILNIVLILGGGKYHWMTLAHTTTVTQVVLVVLIACYVGYAFCFHNAKDVEIMSARKEKEEEEQCAVAAAATMGQVDAEAEADCDC